MANIIKDSNFVSTGKNVKLDSRKRVSLPKALVKEGIIYNVYQNSVGQIVLDPRVTIPASEAWVFNNPDVLALVKRGLADASAGRVSRIDLDTL